jgi:cytoskeletal protein CcmA (bactofilin family)
VFGKEMARLKSFLGTQSQLHGELIASGILRLDGAVAGRIQADEVILTETSRIKGDIIAKRIIVGGNVEGTLSADDLVEIGSKGCVDGEIYTNRLIMVEGGKFNGRIRMEPGKPNVLDFEAKVHSLSAKR